MDLGLRRLSMAAAVAAAALLGATSATAIWDSGSAVEASSVLVRGTGTTEPTPQGTTSTDGSEPAAASAAGATRAIVPVRDAVPPPVAPEARRAPTRVTLPDAQLPLTPVGVHSRGEQAGQMAVPDDPNVGGWYRFGASPLDRTGAVVIAAHVDAARYGPGPLARLDRIPKGSFLTLSVDGRDVRYRIERVEIVPKDKLDPAALFDSAGPARLHLVSCGGEFDPKRGEYVANVVATAVRVA